MWRSNRADNPGITSVDILDFDAGSNTNPVLRHPASMTFGRRYVAPVILPNGKLIIFGGSANGNGTNPVYIPEMFDPVTETWQTYGYSFCASSLSPNINLVTRWSGLDGW